MSAKASNAKVSAISVKGGSFEGCFANGLDLSEFGLNNDVVSKKSSSSSSASFSSSVLVPGEIKPATSYSAQLLQIRQKEAVQKEIDWKEDERFHTIARDRSAQLQQSITDRSKMEMIPVAMLKARHPNDDRDSKTGHLEIIGTSAEPNDDGFLQALIGGMHQQSSYDSRGKQQQHRNNRTKKGNPRHQDHRQGKPMNHSIKINTKISSKFQHKIVARKSKKCKY
jgi:hypothetical protein